jgi:PEP-CTERM motif
MIANMIRKFLMSMALGMLGMCLTTAAKADNIHLCDINQFTQCNAGSVIPTFTTAAFVFGTSHTGDTLNLAILNPLASGGNFNSGANLWAVLNVMPNQVFPTFSSTQSQEQGATGFVAGSFQASAMSMGSWTGTVNVGQSITLPVQPVGTIFMAFLTDSSGNLVAVSPWSSSLINVTPPVSTAEPSSLMLLGAGLLGIGLLRRRPLLG